MDSSLTTNQHKQHTEWRLRKPSIVDRIIHDYQRGLALGVCCTYVQNVGFESSKLGMDPIASSGDLRGDSESGVTSCMKQKSRYSSERPRSRVTKILLTRSDGRFNEGGKFPLQNYPS